MRRHLEAQSAKESYAISTVDGDLNKLWNGKEERNHSNIALSNNRTLTPETSFYGLNAHVILSSASTRRTSEGT